MKLPEYKPSLVAFIKGEWDHFLWSLQIGGERFEYKCGSAHMTPHYGKGHSSYWSPKINRKPQDRESVNVPDMKCWAHVPRLRDVLESLHSDYQAGNMSFTEFCNEFGYSNDSLKALDVYRSCEEICPKLRKALGSEFSNLERWLHEEEEKEQAKETPQA